MRRLRIFAKGNLDVRDCLHSCRIGGVLAWNGLNEIVRPRYAGMAVHVRHETCTRSDALLQAGGIPSGLGQRCLPLGAYTMASQFSGALFEFAADAFVLSIQPDLMTALVRHRREGYLFLPYGWQSWPDDDRQWLHRNFEAAGLLSPEAAMANLEVIAGRLRKRSPAPILVFNASSVVPGEWIHSYAGLDETLSTRIKRFNLALVELSQRVGLSIVDVDAIVARGGADRLKYDALHLTAEGCRLVAEDVVRILDDLGCISIGGANSCA